MYSHVRLATAVPILTMIMADENNYRLKCCENMFFFFSTNKLFFTIAKFLAGADSGCYFGDIGLNKNYD